MVDVGRVQAAIAELLSALGVSAESDPELRRTPELVARAYRDELLVGYAMSPAEILADSVSADDATLVVLREIETVTICPHHLLPASGVVHVAYAPGDRSVGL